jgi:hypothetical protein
VPADVVANLVLGVFPLFKLRPVIVSLIIAAPSISLAFDLGTLGAVVNSFNNARSATAGKKYADPSQSLVENLAKRVDNGDDTFVMERTRKNRVVSRFERAMADSGLTPSHKTQFTNPVEIVQGETTFHELWALYLFKGRGGAEQLAVQRWFLLCDKGVIGSPGSVYYYVTDGARAVDEVYLLTSVYTEKEYHEYRGPTKAMYEAICKTVGQQQKNETIEAKPETSESQGANRGAGGLLPPAPTPLDMRVSQPTVQ